MIYYENLLRIIDVKLNINNVFHANFKLYLLILPQKKLSEPPRAAYQFDHRISNKVNYFLVNTFLPFFAQTGYSRFDTVG